MKETGEFTEGTLVVVWNAASGWQHSLMDSLHKVVSPGTYSCRLCQLTHGLAGPKVQWTRFLEGLGREVVFYHKDAFQRCSIAENVPGLEPPVVLCRTPENWQILLSRDEIMRMETLEGLLRKLGQRIQ